VVEDADAGLSGAVDEGVGRDLADEQGEGVSVAAVPAGAASSVTIDP